MKAKYHSHVSGYKAFVKSEESFALNNFYQTIDGSFIRIALTHGARIDQIN